MFVYNITSKVDHGVLEEWLHWQKETFIPQILATGCFYDHRFYQLLEHEEEDGKTFVVQFLASSKSDYNRYLENHSSALRQKSLEMWKDSVVSFRTLLVEVP